MKPQTALARAGSQLLRYEAMCQAIAECHQVDEVKEIRDRARAFEVYAKQALNLEAERKAAEIRIRAERKAGELLREMKQKGERQKRGDNRKMSSHTTSQSTLAELGVTRDQSSKWQQLAEIPAEEFEAEIAKPGPALSTEGLINSRLLKANPMPRINQRALAAWGRLLDLERVEYGRLVELNLFELYQGMTEPMQADLDRISPIVMDWLEAFLDERKRNCRNGQNRAAKRHSAR